MTARHVLGQFAYHRKKSSGYIPHLEPDLMLCKAHIISPWVFGNRIETAITGIGLSVALPFSAQYVLTIRDLRNPWCHKIAAIDVASCSASPTTESTSRPPVCQFHPNAAEFWGPFLQVRENAKHRMCRRSGALRPSTAPPTHLLSPRSWSR